MTIERAREIANSCVNDPRVIDIGPLFREEAELLTEVFAEKLMEHSILQNDRDLWQKGYLAAMTGLYSTTSKKDHNWAMDVQMRDNKHSANLAGIAFVEANHEYDERGK